MSDPNDKLFDEWKPAIEKGENPALWLVFADFLEENGFQGEAEGWRWLVTNKKCPFYYNLLYPWTWWTSNEKRLLIRQQIIPIEIFKFMNGKYYSDTGLDYKTKFEALHNAALAYSKYQQER